MYVFGIVVRDDDNEQKEYISEWFSSIGKAHLSIIKFDIKKIFPNYRYIEGAWIENENKKMIVLEPYNNYKMQQ